MFWFRSGSRKHTGKAPVKAARQAPAADLCLYRMSCAYQDIGMGNRLILKYDIILQIGIANISLLESCFLCISGLNILFYLVAFNIYNTLNTLMLYQHCVVNIITSIMRYRYITQKLFKISSWRHLKSSITPPCRCCY